MPSCGRRYDLGDFDRITALVAQVHDGDAALSATLAQWAYNFDLESFSRALDELSSPSAQPNLDGFSDYDNDNDCVSLRD